MTAYPDQHLFLRIVELGSLRAVARERGLEPSSVSRRITALEHRLNAKLLNRAQGAARPTEAGQRYYRQLRHLLAELEELDARIAGEGDAPRGLLRVSAAIDFGQRFVAKWLLGFRAAHPEVEVQLNLSARRVDLVASGIDVAFRTGPQPDSSLKARKLADLHRVLVAAPAYLADRGTPHTPAELEEHDHIFFLPEHRHEPIVLTGPDGRVHRVMRRGPITLNAVASIREAVLAGAGVHLGPRWAFRDDIAAGRAIELMPEYRAEPFALQAVWAPSVVLPARIRAFVDHCQTHIADIPGLRD